MLAEKLKWLLYVRHMFVIQSSSVQSTSRDCVGPATLSEGTELPVVRMSYSLRTLQRYLYIGCFLLFVFVALVHSQKHECPQLYLYLGCVDKGRLCYVKYYATFT